jgi:heparosan-N-sulfate-glucuronate 5-epimerase
VTFPRNDAPTRERKGAGGIHRPSLQRHLQSALSLGEGFEPQPAGDLFELESVHGYFIDFRAKTTSIDAHLPETWEPAPLAQLALGWWERSLRGEERGTREFCHACDLLAQSAQRRGQEAIWPYMNPLRKYRVDPPWCSAMAQGQIASVFTRAYRLTAEPRYAELARAACVPLRVATESRVLLTTEKGPVLEEIPSNPPSQILNGWIFALWGLWEVSVGLAESEAGDMFAASLDCLRRTIDSYDVGWWTRYSLYPHLITDLAKPFYHKLHIVQVTILYRLSGFAEFRDAAQRWRTYDTRSRRVGAVGHKALFVATKHV